MKSIIILNKKEGETPLETLEVFRNKKNKTNDKYKNLKMTYAGRLDPMASGLLLILTGEEVKNKEKYLLLKKNYEFEILFGFATDTYDILGKVINRKKGGLDRGELIDLIEKKLKRFKGKFFQKYPIFSSKTVSGKPLFEYARAGIAVKLPSREVDVKDINFTKLRKIDNRKLLRNIEKRIKKIKGDFRQKQILNTWKKNLLIKKQNEFYIGKFTVICSSGTYVRGIANQLGEEIGIPALAFSIKRTKIGKWSKPS
ncbi:MAG: hypothetical protein ABIS26_00680 [Candidatus Paceibacterota bacterium]